MKKIKFLLFSFLIFLIIFLPQTKAGEEGFRNIKVRKTFEASLDVDVLISCLDENDGNYCYDTFINGNEKVILQNEEEEQEVIPVRMQLNEEVTAIRNKISIYQAGIRANRNPIINFIEGLNLRNILG